MKEALRNKQVQWLITMCIALVGIAIDFKAFYPGFISPDSLDQFNQAYTHQYSDWHPPIMAGFWSLLLKIHPSGVPMFVLQVLVYWAAFVVLMRVGWNFFRHLAWLIPALFFAPFMQNFVGNIWKDVGLSISWLLACAILLNAFFEKRPLKKTEALFTFILLCYGCWIRINALPGVLPLLSMWLLCLNKEGINATGIKKLVWQTAVATALVISGQLTITRLILKPMHTYPQYKLFVHDLTGIYKETGVLYFPEFIRNHPGFDSLYIKEKYIYSTFDNIWWNNDNKQILPSAGDEEMSELQDCWMKAILKHPLAYIKNRGLGLLNFLRITSSGSELAITYTYIHPNNYGLEFTPNKLTLNLRRAIEWQRPMPYMQPWFWLLLNLLILFLASGPLFKPVKRMVLCLAYSSLFYFLLEFIVFQADTEFRYFYWNCVALSLATVLMLVEKYKGKSQAGG